MVMNMSEEFKYVRGPRPFNKSNARSYRSISGSMSNLFFPEETNEHHAVTGGSTQAIPLLYSTNAICNNAFAAPLHSAVRQSTNYLPRCMSTSSTPLHFSSQETSGKMEVQAIQKRFRRNSNDVGQYHVHQTDPVNKDTVSSANANGSSPVHFNRLQRCQIHFGNNAEHEEPSNNHNSKPIYYNDHVMPVKTSIPEHTNQRQIYLPRFKSNNDSKMMASPPVTTYPPIAPIRDYMPNNNTVSSYRPPTTPVNVYQFRRMAPVRLQRIPLRYQYDDRTSNFPTAMSASWHEENRMRTPSDGHCPNHFNDSYYGEPLRQDYRRASIDCNQSTYGFSDQQLEESLRTPLVSPAVSLRSNEEHRNVPVTLEALHYHNGCNGKTSLETSSHHFSPSIGHVEERHVPNSDFITGIPMNYTEKLAKLERFVASHNNGYHSDSGVAEYDNNNIHNSRIPLPTHLFRNPANQLPSPPLAKSQKKVVFQCDADMLRRLSTPNGGNQSTGSPPPASSMRAAEEQPPPSSIVQYDNAVSEPLQHFMSLCSKIGGDADTVTGNVRAVFTAQRNLIWTAAGQQEMPPAQLQGALQPVSQKLDEISAFRETRRNTPLFNLLSSIADGIQAIGWLAVKPTPAPFIKEMIDAAMFFVNRVLKEKARDSDEAECSKAWIATLNALHLYVRQVHTTGLVWNSNPGSSPTSASSNSSVPQPPPGPPPPPPPPPMPMGLLSTGDKKTDNAAREALFADLNRGLDVTKGLKKVTADMQTHKNPTLKQQGPVVSTGTAPSSKSANASGSATAVMQKKTPRIELENGKQWNVEFHVGNKNLEIEVTDMKQTMYIYQCTDSMIRVKGKLNSITLDGCRKTGVVVDSLVSQIEIINCQSMQIQTLGHLPMISIQKTDGCQMILSKESMKAEFVTSKSSEMNIMIPTSDGDFIELPIPEQFKTVYDGKRLVTTVSDIV